MAGPEVCRHYIPTGAAKRLEIDFNEWAIKAVDEHSGRAVVVAALAQCTAGNLKHAACAVLQLEAEEHVLMSYEGMKGDPETVRGPCLAPNFSARCIAGKGFVWVAEDVLFLLIPTAMHCWGAFQLHWAEA